MAVCGYCSSTIIFGGITSAGKLYCSERCSESARLLRLSEKVPYKLVLRKLDELHRGPCPKCGGPGPVDVYRSYRICSALVVSRWTNVPEVCCRKCAAKNQIVGVLYSLCLGWWSIPWGIILTPVQIYRNLRALFHTPRLDRPSSELEHLVRVGLAARIGDRRSSLREANARDRASGDEAL
ncbi:MAG: hypothetical protein N3G20_06205 [Verrucomicrobiae bacterium]|nr:hypothetical protein [Verrucomicrobiae bacterium]